jgi:AcrR family transcriptional regulator
VEKRLKPGKVERRQGRMAAEDRRRQLVSIALDLIATKGFEGLRFQEVARIAGINNATLFYHFSTKEELIQGVIEHLGEEFRKTPAPPDGKPRTAIEELRFEFEEIGQLLRKQPKLFLVMTEISLRALRDPAIEKVVRALDDLWRRHLMHIIRLGIQDGTFRSGIDVVGAAAALMAQIKGIGFHSITGKLKRREAEQAIAEITNQVQYWLCADKQR